MPAQGPAARNRAPIGLHFAPCCRGLARSNRRTGPTAMPASEPSAAAARSTAGHRFGRFVLLELLGRSDRSMAWQATDPRSAQPCIVVLPRQQPASAAILQRWQGRALRAARLEHPGLASILEISTHDGWPYVAYDARGAEPLSVRLRRGPLGGREAAGVVHAWGSALAYAHESGVVHGDVQPFLVTVDEAGRGGLLGLEVALEAVRDVVPGGPGAHARSLADSDLLRLTREAAQRDVLGLGLLLHAGLSAQYPLDEPDLGRVIARMPPLGRDLVRLPWSTPQPIPEALRAIANRATDRQERQRYRSIRTLIHALDGWLRAEGAVDGGGALALLLDRLNTVGLLPGSPTGVERAARLATMESQRTVDLAEVVLEDLALSFELLRAVNAAAARGLQLGGSGPVLTIRRAIAMLGMDGVRRAANALRPWPGPLSEQAAQELRLAMMRAHRAARVAQALRPAEWDPEVVSLVTLLQNLGPLLIQYHFPEDAQQIRRLTQPAPAPDPEDPPLPGMTHQAASFAVLGIDVDTVGSAVARHWGLDDEMAAMMRRLPLDGTVHVPGSDGEFLRLLGSCANETLEASTQAAGKVAQALAKVAQRYARVLHVTVSDLHAALEAARAPGGAGGGSSGPAPAGRSTPGVPAPQSREATRDGQAVPTQMR